MDETKKLLQEQFEKGKEIGSNPNISVGTALQQITQEMQTELNSASSYSKARAQRKNNVAKRLQDTRKSCGLRQQDVAAQTGINVITLSGYEIGRSEPNIEALVRLADVYQVSLDYLTCRIDQK